MEGPEKGQAFSPQEIDVLITIERVGAGCSMVAITLVMLSYWAFKKLRTTPNLFLLFASMANAGASVASMIGYDGLERGEDSTLCQAQAFIFEWFMQSDPWWSFAMAINVFLVFFLNANPRTFRQYAWLYCVICFGGPMIPAIVLISVRDHPDGLIFGDATLWCWIGTDWSLVRLYSYYIPIWIFSLLSIIIYIAVGFHVFHHRNLLRNVAADRLGSGEKNGNNPYSSSDAKGSSEANLTGRQEFYGTAVTEVQITSSVPRRKHQDEPAMPGVIHPGMSPNRARSWALPASYEHLEPNTPTRPQRFETTCTSDSTPNPPPTIASRLRAVKSNASLKLKRLDPVKMAYLRTSFIFGFAVLITWIPSSVNRLYSLTHHDKISFPLSVASGCVLPLQGVWNALIYFTTSWKTFCEEIRAVKAQWFRRRGEAPGAIRLDSRLGSLRVEHRDTFERAQQGQMNSPWNGKLEEV
ncbi:hypothetical protein NW754_000706 [Fusarium falciforme]|uniref:G-protein coupled receptors family 2 profile 2 domain-containing protein n=1 Tax=Fusarium falciforme TaxID=195108 RepID=A0A9W8V0X6_9HYPO|nr:hypothetical protein NW754_000706 [Fusarium falciforme]KAJ4187629.1 hypothetical protein NW755_007122 [Fusarium falciforme]KAJ4255937.1 hypothetical protein NW757_004561 [Fusarium falciforme]